VAAAPLGPAEFARITELDLAGLMALSSLDLTDLPVTDAGLKELARADMGLKGLNAAPMTVTDAGVEAAQARWPGIRVPARPRKDRRSVVARINAPAWSESRSSGAVMPAERAVRAASPV
jgi:hypothetical protein